MKKIFLLILLLYVITNTNAQLTITPGAQFVLTGNAQLTLSNIDFVNNGSFTAGSGSVLFTGNLVNLFTGGQNTTLYDLGIGKTAGSLQLQVPLAVSHQVVFSAGLIDLNGNDLNLGNTGSLNGEQEASHIIGPNGGSVLFTTSLAAPAAANPGNLGILITSSQNLGNTIIKRGHQSQVNAGGTGNSIFRYYDILPANNTSLNATLRINYLDAELNGLDENSLGMYQQAIPAWTNLGFDSRNTSSNYVEKNRLSTFGRFTLSSVNNALPVKFILFTAQCNGSTVLITWKTAQEQNSHYYQVQRSTNAVDWTGIGTIAAAGNSTTENSYSYTDNSPIGNAYYRVAEYDLDGKAQYTQSLTTACSIRDVVRVWPNPVTDILYINFPATANGELVIKLFDGKGALIRQQSASAIRGNNLVSVPVKGMAAGIYYVSIISSSNHVQTQRIMKE